MLRPPPSPPNELRRDIAAPSSSRVPGIVRVRVSPMHRPQTECTCGWRGRRRILRASAVIDVLIHASTVGCLPAVPLVDVDIGRRP